MSVKKFGQFVLILIIATTWVFSGWPQIFNFPPKIQTAQAATTGPSFPTSGVNDTSIGVTAWTAPGNVTASDNTRATASPAKTSTTQALKATGFGFAIPSDANIDGITVEWETSEQGLTAAAGIKDNAVRLVRAGTIEATDRSNTTFWVAPASEAFVSYGGVADLWGATWTATDINNANFGAAISGINVKISGGGGVEGANVDSVRITVTYTLPTYTQSAYRLFNNLDSTDVGTTLAAQDTAATLGSTGAAFRLRMLLHIGAAQLGVSAQNFKLQFAAQSGTCDTAFSGETYADVTAATVIAYNNNATPADGATLTANASDPTHGADTIVNQTYEELNNFTNSVAAIPSGQDGKWDFSLFDNGATASTAYCLRAVLSTGTVIDTYTVIPQITTAASAPAQTITFSLGATSLAIPSAGNLSSSAVSSNSHTVTVATNAASGMVVTYSGTTLTSGANTITAMSTATASSVGTEQFGINAVANTTPAVGAACSGTPTIATAATGYAVADNFKFVSGETIVSSAGTINSTTCTISYITNITAPTAAGSYTTTLTYVATATF